MSTFAELAARTSVGCAYFLECSSDGFVTVTRYSTHAGKLDGTNMMEPRIKGLGNIERAFGGDYGVTSGTASVVLDNTDGALDWLADQATFATVLKTRFKLWCVLFDPADVTNYATKQLGRFTCMDLPKRTPDAIELALADDMLGDAAGLASTPTLRDWFNTTDANRPVSAEPGNSYHPVEGIDYDAPLPLYFGSNPLPLTRVGYNVYVLCCCEASAHAEGTITLDVLQLGNGQVLDSTWWGVYPNGTPVYQQFTVWTARASASISKGGKSWRIVWVKMDVLVNAATPGIANYDQSYSLLLAKGYNLATLKDKQEIYDFVGPITVRDHIGSQTYNAASALTDSIHAADVAYNLLGTYSSGLSTSDLTAAGFTSAKAANPAGTVSGIVQQGVQVVTTDNYVGAMREKVSEVVGGGELVSALRGICTIGRFDIFCSWGGLVKCAPDVADFSSQTTTPTALDETLLGRVEEYMPSVGQRHYPFNRLYVTAGGQRYGPLDNAAAYTAWGRWLSKTIDGSWAAWQVPNAATRWLLGFPEVRARFSTWQSGVLRPMLRVEYWGPPVIANLELGDYVTLPWSRGTLGSPYTSATVWRVEGIGFDPESQKATLTLCWANDLTDTSNLPYLLDDETIASRIRATGSGGRTCTVTSASSTISFSSGSLVTDNVAAGDMLVITDSTESATAFKRSRVVRVASVTDATHLVYTGSTDWGAAGPYTTSSWQIQRGALTFPTAVIDATNYPSGGTMYGKVSDSVHPGRYSDTTTYANKLLEG